MSPDEAMRRADAAARIMAEPVVKDAIESIKREITAQWAATPARDADAREWIWRHYKVAEKFEGILRGYIETGRFEAAVMEKKSAASKMKEFVRQQF